MPKNQSLAENYYKFQPLSRVWQEILKQIQDIWLLHEHVSERYVYKAHLHAISIINILGENAMPQLQYKSSKVITSYNRLLP